MKGKWKPEYNLLRKVLNETRKKRYELKQKGLKDVYFLPVNTKHKDEDK